MHTRVNWASSLPGAEKQGPVSVSLGRVAFTKRLRVHSQTSAGASVAPREQPWLICPSSLEHHRCHQDTFHKNMNRSGLSQAETLRPLPLRDKCLLGLRPFARYPASYGNLASSGKTRRTSRKQLSRGGMMGLVEQPPGAACQ